MKITLTKGGHRCEVCGSSFVIRWSGQNGSAWRCLRHSITLLTRGA